VWAAVVRERDLTAYGDGAGARYPETMAPQRHRAAAVGEGGGESVGNVNWTVRIFTGHKGWPSLRRDSYPHPWPLRRRTANPPCHL